MARVPNLKVVFQINFINLQDQSHWEPQHSMMLVLIQDNFGRFPHHKIPVQEKCLIVIVLDLHTCIYEILYIELLTPKQ